MLETIKGAIFDLDGTLIDSMGIWGSIGTDFLLSHNITPPEDIEKTLKSMSFYQSAEYFRDKYHINHTPEEIMALVYAQVAEHYKTTIPLKDSIEKYLKVLQKKGAKMGIATASNKRLAFCALKRLGILEYFEFILTCDEIGVGKDEPKIYLEAAALLEIDKENIYVFEDALYCVKTAKAAGFKVVGVYDASSEQDREELEKVCDHFIVSFKELL
ncbi:HAD family hydrolase [Cellulosilyticum sp. I15G10I2]|uniref:HAD family hydrolase n=1 Tax=Cellulosilyticum sp. I15G10I2 TaxID=1892843 RepID=UPI00085C2EEF|nr:HAD family phosphatase [Cellulosilyticum sp. I15G10I2]